MGGWFNQSVRSMISIFARCFIERRVAACENRLFIIFSILAPNSFSFFSTAPQSDRTRWGRLDPGATGHMFDVGSFTFSFTFFYVRLLSFTNVSACGLRRRVCLRLFTFVYKIARRGCVCLCLFTKSHRRICSRTVSWPPEAANFYTQT